MASKSIKPSSGNKKLRALSAHDMENLRNIIFDLGGVLVGLDGSRSVAAFNRLGCEDVSRYIEEHRTEDLFLRIELGLISTREFCEEVRRMTGTTAPDDEIVAAWNALIVLPTAARRRGLQALRQAGHRLFLLSNTNDMHWKKWEASSLLPLKGEVFKDGVFEKCFLSYELHLAKPSREIFEAVLQQADIKADETLFIDDSLKNCEAAQALGIHTYHNQHINDWLT